MLSCSALSRRALTASGTALVATLLPLALAAPALAEDVVPVPVVSEPTTATPAPTTPAKQTTVVRISGPSSATLGKTIRVYARLLADDQPVINGVVRLQRWNGSSWVEVGRINTGEGGLGSTGYVLNASSRLRAYYPGAETRTPAESAPITVTATKTLGMRAIDEAKRHYQKPYRYGATGPDRFDCSGFSGYVFRTLGKSLPRTSGQQQAATRRIANSSKQVGDLIFTWYGGRVTHVGIYAGNNTMWAATKTGDVVRTQSIYSRTYTVGRVG
jgi:cell wall-associated NlpC family hydrolase